MPTRSDRLKTAELMLHNRASHPEKLIIDALRRTWLLPSEADIHQDMGHVQTPPGVKQKSMSPALRCSPSLRYA
nr:hypothetical protein CFP56_24631 [Quercus suber]